MERNVASIGGAKALVVMTMPPAAVGLESRLGGTGIRFGKRSEMRIGMELKLGRSVWGRGFGSNGRRSEVGTVVVPVWLFGRGRGPLLPRITVPLRPGQHEDEELSAGDELLTNDDTLEDAMKKNVGVLKNGHSVESTSVTNHDANVLQDQFNRFAAAVALADRKMAEEIIREMGDGDSPGPIPMDFSEENLDLMEEINVSGQVLDDSRHEVSDKLKERKLSELNSEGLGNSARVCDIHEYVEDVSDLERQLDELYEEVDRMIEEGEEETARELIEANYEALLEQLDTGVQGVEQVAMLDILAQLYMNMGDSKNAEALLKQINGLLERISSPQPLLDNILEHTASMYLGIGKPLMAIPLYFQSLDIQRSKYGKNDPLTARTILGLAKAFNDNGEGNKSIELYRQVVVLLGQSKGQEDESLLIPLTHLGNTLLEEDRLEEAHSVLLRALRVTQRAYGALDGRVGLATCALARAKAAQGQVDEAISLYRQGLDIIASCSKFSSGDPVVEVIRTDLAEILNVLGRDAEAQELWEENLHIKEEELGSNDFQLVPHLLNAATSYGHSEKFEKCELMLRQCLKLMSNHYGPRAPQVSIPLEMLATCVHRLGRGLEAEYLAREAVSIRESHYGELHPITGESYNCLAAILHDLKQDEEAEKLLRKVLKIQEQELGSDCPEIILTLDLLATLLNEQGRTVELKSIVHRIEKLESFLTNSADSPINNQ